MSSSEEEPETKKTKLGILPTCPYGSSCYRKNPQHFKEYSHPGSSKDTGASKPASGNTDLPECKYGVNCYRKNLLHFAEFSHPFKGGKQMETDSSGSDTDVVNSDKEEVDKEKSKKKADGKDVTLSSATSLVKRYSQMTEDERKDLIKKALEMKEQLQKELTETKKQVEEKNQELERLQKEVNSGLMLEGEREALEGTEIKYFPLIPERHYKEGSAAQVHFRLAESQFYRLLSGAYSNQYRVSKVEYVVNPVLVKKFKKSQEEMKKKRGEAYSYPILAFHGTEEKNIVPICQTGFKVPGIDDPKLTHRMNNEGLYGKGIYFSEFTHYSIAYVAGATKILLNKVLPGKIYMCSGMTTGIPLKDGYDSHMSPCKKELVIFHSQRILPCYIVHYKATTQEFKYVKPVAEENKVTKQDELMKRYWKARKAKNSRCLAGFSVKIVGKLCDDHKELGTLVQKHGGKYVGDVPGGRWASQFFNILVTTESHQAKGGMVFTQAMTNKAVVVRQEFLYDSILKNKKLEPEDYEIE